MFTKDGDQVNNLFDMQCTWYEIECGRAWLRRGVYGKVCNCFVSVRVWLLETLCAHQLFTVVWGVQ